MPTITPSATTSHIFAMEDFQSPLPATVMSCRDEDASNNSNTYVVTNFQLGSQQRQ